MELKEIFERKIKIEAKVISIESLFNNPDRVRETDYQPPYQRNYVWDDEKATYFIESILLGTEIPPLVYFVSSGKTEIVDGRQRYQTILRFTKNEFKLKKAGLQKLENIGIAGKSFKDLEVSTEHSPNLTELFWDTKLRIITFSFHSPEGINEEIEDMVKKEIFQRYNSGITPLKQTDIAKANYLEDDLNEFIKTKISGDAIIRRDVSSVFHFEKSNIELIMKSIRESLVLHNIPIKYYAVKKQSVVSKFYDILYSEVDDDMANDIFSRFISKMNLLLKIKDKFSKNDIVYNRLASECFFWAFSILEKENVSLSVIDDKEIDTLVTWCKNHFEETGNPFESTRSSFAKEIYSRYQVTAKYFCKYKVSFEIYLDTTEEFKGKNRDVKTDAPDSVSFNDLRINKPEPSSIAIIDLCRLIQRQKFLIRPQYQREEVINKKKSSAIIESILLGIKIPPIFVYKRKDGISEVLDGQQRLLSILGFIQKGYLDVNNEMAKSDKDGFSLSLKTGILTELNKKSFKELTIEDQKKINDFDLWIIEINATNNPYFEPIDLFLRLNNKPYPIKSDTFEMWNSFISRDIIETVKSLYANYKEWFYIRKNNARMENENLYTSLAYFQYLWNDTPVGKMYEYDGIDIYKVGTRINFRVRSKNEITKILQESDKKLRFLDALNDLDSNFIGKLMILLSEENTEKTSQLNQKMDELIASDNGKRTQQNLYALWFFLFDIPRCSVNKNKKNIIRDVKELFSSMMNISSKESFLDLVSKFKTDYYTSDNIEASALIALSYISELHNGIQAAKIQSEDTILALFFDGKSDDAKISSNSLIKTNILKSDKLRECHLLIKKDNALYNRINVLYSDKKTTYSTNYIGLSITRHNFLSKYVYSFLSSSYVCCLIDIKEISISKIKVIQIPVIPLAKQRLFSNVTDYYMESESNSTSYLLFRRLLDVMVYELCFEADFIKAKIDIIKHTDLFVELPENRDEIKEQISRVYSIISNPNHTLSSNMLKVLSIDEVMKIDSLI